VIDLAVGIVIGTAFGKIVNSLVNDMIMPPIGMRRLGETLPLPHEQSTPPAPPASPK